MKIIQCQQTGKAGYLNYKDKELTMKEQIRKLIYSYISRLDNYKSLDTKYNQTEKLIDNLYNLSKQKKKQVEQILKMNLPIIDDDEVEPIACEINKLINNETYICSQCKSTNSEIVLDSHASFRRCKNCGHESIKITEFKDEKTIYTQENMEKVF